MAIFLNMAKRTIFNTPCLEAILHRASQLILGLAGWRMEGRLPQIPKFVLVGAPHTSNWDLPFTLLMAFAFGARIHWLGKKALFRRPFNGFFQWLGGIPVQRSRSENLVEQSIQQFRHNEKLILTIAPSGTRKNVVKWKSGFYHIACGAKVPIVLGFLDYQLKVGGFGPTIHPTGDIATDMETIRAFYGGVSGKNHPRPIPSGGPNR
jgi:1-acyl-sn-glycerol-3-phosphate acyltransferase